MMKKPSISAIEQDHVCAGLATTRLDAIRLEPLRWLVPDYLPLGKLVLLAGDGGHGKSTLTADLTASLTTGRPAFGLDYPPHPPCDVLLITCEDDYADTVLPRLLSAGADLTRIHRVDGLRSANGHNEPFSLVHFREIEAELQHQPNVRLVIIDPAGAYVGRTGCDDHRDSELRALLGPLTEVAARCRTTILLVKHLAKNATTKAVYRVMGSAGYVNAVRAALLLCPDADDEERRLLLPLKENLTPRRVGLAFRLIGLELDRVDEILMRHAAHLAEEDRLRLAGQLYRVDWQGTATVSADDALTALSCQPRTGSSDLERATVWLKEFLAHCPQQSPLCVEQGNTALDLSKRLAWWRDSVLKKRLGGKPRKHGMEGGWYFTLSSHEWPPQQNAGQRPEDHTQDEDEEDSVL